MLWQYRLLGEVRWIDWLLVPWHGLPLDISVASYITAVAGVLLCISFWVRWDIIGRIEDGFTGLILFIGLWTMLGDNGCFPSWGYHLNKDIFSYLASPKEALACAPWWVWILGCVGFVVLFMGWWRIYKKWVRKKETIEQTDLSSTSGIVRCALSTVGMLLLSGALFLPMRGSVTVSTMNTGRVYFSDNRMLNLAAINPVFNIIETLSEDQFQTTKYQYMPSEEAARITSQLLMPCDTVADEQVSLLRTCRPNIVLFILESFSKNAMDAGAMPCLQKIAGEGVFFSNAYAASYRTDRGVVAALGAFQGSATASLMLVPDKSGRMPQVGQILKKEGYRLKFFYGGDEDFTNMRSYLITGGFDERVADRDFPISDRISKWGVPDHILFARAANEIAHRAAEDNHFDVILSLSSHEPFEVPCQRFEHPYLNAVAYTDSCLGAFMDTLRQSPVWDSTLVVMVADHGYAYPDGTLAYDTLRYKIPLVLSGGAVCAPQQIQTLCQQVDWVPTVLHQMGLDASMFPFAKDILDKRISPFAYYNFVDGFALLTDTAVTVVDAKVEQVILGSDDKTLVHQAKALTQRIMETIDQL
ncbi:MAG: LTA synthase family protein [Paludibacteraceae bacterium]|nr:LTA synthase family protein [Paludibacteraceae bacterium]